MDLILREYKIVVKRNIEAVKGQIRKRRFIIAIDETHEPFYGRIKTLWIHDYKNGVKGATGSYKYIVVSIVSGDLRFILLVIPIPKISTCIAILPDYKGFDWFFATNIEYDKIFRYVRYYKKRWGIETTFRVQDEVRIRTKSSIPVIRFALFVFGCMLYNVWQFFKGRVPFRRLVNILFRRHIIKTAVFAVIALLKEKDFLDDKGPPPDKIYEELIGKFGYFEAVSVPQGC